MPAILVVVGIAVIGAVIARVTWRRPADERHSIQSHQQTLDTLRSMADRRPGTSGESLGPAAGSGAAKTNGGHVRTGPPPAASRAGAAGTGPRQANTRSAPGRASPATKDAGGGELVFDDGGAVPSEARVDGSPRISPIKSVRGLHRTGRVDRLSRRRRGGLGRLAPAAAAIVVLGVVVAVAVALAPSHKVPRVQTSAPRTKVSHGVVRQPAGTTAPTAVQPTTSASNSADYGAPSTQYAVGLTATGACWVSATQASTGAVVWTGTLQPGQTQAVTATGTVIVRLGAPTDVTVTLNGTPVVLPTGMRAPFDMHFVAA